MIYLHRYNADTIGNLRIDYLHRMQRVYESEAKVTATSSIAQMYIHKQDIYTEKKIYPYAQITDLRLDLLPRVRQMAVNHAGGEHPWKDLSDEELLKSAGLYGTDMATGESGYNLAAIMLLGKDDVILNVCPACGVGISP
ncbi:MAG: hypothetical protein LUG93_12460 [Lachnospiraceae bacterium]|nr:hypothetical protein [Lachnospiraceae bacterium]